MKKSTWFLIFVCQFLLIAWWQGLIGTNGILPNPTPDNGKIYCTNQAELNVVQSALRIAERDWKEKADPDISEAITGLDFLMGGKEDGVHQEVQEKILVEFTGGRDFLESLAEVRNKLAIK